MNPFFLENALGQKSGKPEKRLSSYRYGFNGHEKDDEIKGEENHLSFGDYGYDSRIGRRWNTDPIFRHNLSSYLFAANNPIIFIDLDGRTEFYANGKWIGTDGVDNNMVAVITSAELKQQIISNTKEGKTTTIGEVQNGEGEGYTAINIDLLRAANNILSNAIADGKQGRTREFAAVLDAKENGGYDITYEHVSADQEIEGEGQKVTGGDLPGGDVSIHSHPTTSKAAKNDYGQNIVLSFDAKEPSEWPNDKVVFKKFELNIIVGKSGLAAGKYVYDQRTGRNDQFIVDDNRSYSINMFDSESESNGSISRGMAIIMLSGDKGKLGRKYEKAKSSQ